MAPTVAESLPESPSKPRPQARKRSNTRPPRRPILLNKKNINTVAESRPQAPAKPRDCKRPQNRATASARSTRP